MMIYVDSDFKCHVINDDTMTAFEIDFFDGKCDAFIEGYCYETKKSGIAIYPWKNYEELAAAQRAYEKQQLSEANAKLNDLTSSYQEGINSI